MRDLPSRISKAGALLVGLKISLILDTAGLLSSRAGLTLALRLTIYLPSQ